MSMRPYQKEAIDGVTSYWRNGIKKTMIHLGTGGGKTHIFSEIIKRTQANNHKCIVVVRGRQLVEQASERLFREKVNHGVLMAGAWNKNSRALVQVCSIDTIIARNEFPEAKLVVIDEAHLFTSPKSIKFVEHYSSRGSFIIAVTATPWTREPLNHLADAIIHPVAIGDLIDQGYLVPPRYFAPSVPDLKGLRTVAGDWVNEQLHERMSVLTGDIVKSWQKLGEGRPTICFAVNIKHSLELVAAFKKAGIPAEHIEGNNSREERKAAIQRLVEGKTKILSNVGVLTTGVDIPPASCIIFGRATQSYNLYIQMAGRGTRCDYAPGMPLDTVDQRLDAIEASKKKDFLILDHGGNVVRHGFITNEPEVDLDGIKKKTLDTGPQPRTCLNCYLTYTGPFCPDCPPPEKGEREILVEDGELKEMTVTPFSAEVVQFVRRTKYTAKKHGHDKYWVFEQVSKKYGKELALEIFPKKKPPLPPYLRR